MRPCPLTVGVSGLALASARRPGRLYRGRAERRARGEVLRTDVPSTRPFVCLPS